MKKHLFFLILIALTFTVFAQSKLPVAVNDTVYLNPGEIITINPLVNDYDEDSIPFVISSVWDTYYTISYTDSTVTFQAPEYFIYPMHHQFLYVLKNEFQDPAAYGVICFYPKENQIDTLDINQISAPVYPWNTQFYDFILQSYKDGPIFKYPKDEKTSTVFGSALWIGGKDAQDQLHVSAECYSNYGKDFWSGPLTNDGNATIDSLISGQWFRTWKVNREQINYHIQHYNDPNYIMPEAIKTWPAHGDPDLNQDEFIAPFVDVDQDLEYHPDKGDYPFIKGDQTIFFVFNDHTTHSESGGNEMGLEIHCMAWGMDEQRNENPYNSTVFYSYKIFNKSNLDYFDTYLGIFCDLDLGNSTDDYVGCNVENGNFYVYNGDDFDEDDFGIEDTIFGYHEAIPSQSICILSGPFMDNDDLDNPLRECDESINGSGFGDGEVDNERYGMSRFIYFNSGGIFPTTDPYVAPEYYNYMNGIWKDSSSMLFGGSGYGSEGIEARFMFPGDSDPCNWGTNGIDPGVLWTEETAGNQPGDRRGVASMGPFTFQAGSVEYLDVAYVTAPANSTKNSKELLQDYISQIKQDYLVDPQKFGNQYTGIESIKQEESFLQVYPNPVEGNYIQFELNEERNAQYQIFNAAGQLIQSGSLPSQKQQRINVGDLNLGWYILEINSGNQVYRSKLIK